MTAHTKEELLACVDRELRLRERVYPRWTVAGRMTARKADEEIAAMRAVREAIAKHVPDDEPQAEMFR
jgi:hypothetical protein